MVSNCEMQVLFGADADDRDADDRVIHVPTGTTQRMKKDPHDFVGWVEAPCADTHRVRVRGGYRGAQPTLRFSNETQFEPIFIRGTEFAPPPLFSPHKKEAVSQCRKHQVVIPNECEGS